jgi:hypothetical protein
MTARTTLLVAILITALALPAAAQNSPRDRRDAVANPKPPQPLPGQLHETIEVSRWGKLGGQVGQPQWGTLGGAGWSGVTAQPPR